jgi:hypothetical protein
MPQIAWGAKVSGTFKNKVIAICDDLECDPSSLMAAIAFETGERFTPDVRNKMSGATGLIQFMPKTAEALGTTTDALASMTAEDQLDFVSRYFQPFAKKLPALSDVYMAILLPKAVGKPEAFVLFRSPSKAFQENSGLDVNRDGIITKAEATHKVALKLTKGMTVGLIG